MKNLFAIFLLLISLNTKASVEDDVKTLHQKAESSVKNGDYDAAISVYIESIEILNKFKTTDQKFKAFAELSKIFLLKEDYKKALEYTQLALRVAEELKQAKLIAGANFSLANIYYQTDELNNAITYYTKALTYFDKINLTKNLVETYNNLGLVYKELKEYNNAEKNFLKAYDLTKKNNYKFEKTYIEAELVDLYRLTKNYNGAEGFLNISLKGGKDIDNVMLTKTLDENGYMLYKDMGNYAKSLYFFEVYKKLGDSIEAKNTGDKILEVETKFRTNEKQKEIELLNTKTDLQQSELKKSNILMLLFLLVILAVSVFTFIVHKSRQRQIESNKMLGDKNSQIEHQQKEIVDSITYAKRIQDATLGSIDRIKEFYVNASLLFQPKDILSGDFYWFTKKENKFMFAVADCTGHGVPGAMMSMIGNNALNEAIKETAKKPSEILYHLSNYVYENFSHTDSEIKDSMDIAFCSLDTNTNELEFAGALNSMLICKENGEIIEIKGDKAYIGQKESSYKDTKIQLSKNDCVYIMSDGYCDQFGGKDDKKFKISNLKAKIKEIHGLSSDEQIENLKMVINDWKKNTEQTDDISLLVVRI